jgi:NitT/TauT family transport system substrate-binding protein
MPQSDAAAPQTGMHRRQCLGMLAALAAAGCSSQGNGPLRVGLSTFPPYELMVLARESGYFREAGLDVRLVEFDDLSDAQRAYEQGKIDGLATTLVEVLVTRNSTSRDLRVLRVISASEGADVIMAGADVRRVADLRGRKVAIEIGSLSHFMIARALERAGMVLADVTLVSTAQDAMEAALQKGEVSAVVTYPPNAARLRANPRWHVLFSSQEIPDEVVDVYAFDSQALLRRGRDLQAFFAAIDRASVRLGADPAGSCRIMAPREHIPPDAFCQALTDGIRLIPPAEQTRYLGPAMALRTSVDNVARALARNRLIQVRPGLIDCLEPLKP